jgi:phenylalanyl-tRNA synthetase beta chain
MGGQYGEVSDDTTEILLESAYFTAPGIAKTAKRLGLRSESSARFERGIDPNSCLTGAARALQLLVVIAGAQPLDGAIDVYPQPIERERITVRTARVNALLATELADDDIANYLTPLGIEMDGGIASAPTWRPDLEREIDVVEEVARRIGLDQIARTIPSSPAKVGALTPQQRDRRAITDVLIGAGYDETYSLPLLAPADLERTRERLDNLIEVGHPLRAEESVLRPAILPGLLRAVAFNAAHGESAVAIFETGKVFAPPLPGETLPVERTHLAFARSLEVRRAPHEPNRPVDVYDATAVLQAITGELRVETWFLVPSTKPGFRAGRQATILVDHEFEIGTIGEIAPDVVDAIGATGPVVACELDVGALIAATRTDRRDAGVSRFPGANFDLAFVVADTEAAGELRATIALNAGELLEELRLFDVHRSDRVGAGKVSLAFALRFRAPDRTLTDDEVSTLRQRVIDAVATVHGAELRA